MFRNPLEQLERTVEKTAADGNCALNAFALAICDKYIFHALEKAANEKKFDLNQRFAWFIERVSKAFDAKADWQSVKQAMLKVRDSDKAEYQKKMAPILRELAYQRAIDKDHREEHLNESMVVFLSAFHNYQTNAQVLGDDLFCHKQFIQAKFKEIAAISVEHDFALGFVLEAQKTEQQKEWMRGRSKVEIMQEWRLLLIGEWWRFGGYQQFLESMRASAQFAGDKKNWAGDLELKRLAAYFDVVVDVIPAGGFLYNLYGNYGNFPKLSDFPWFPAEHIDEVMRVLRSRGVISGDGKDGEPTPFCIDELGRLIKRIAKVNDHAAILKFIIENQANLKGMSIAALELPKLVLQELVQRDVINRDHVFAVDAPTAIVRINEIPYYIEVRDLCYAHHKQHPLLVLVHGHDHWENTLVNHNANEQLRREYSMRLFKLREVAQGGVENARVFAMMGSACLFEDSKIRKLH